MCEKKIVWLGHACFKIKLNDVTIMVDPYTDGSVPGLRPLNETTNGVFISHNHHDHNAKVSIDIIEKSLNDIFTIKTIDTFHDDKNGALRGDNTIHIFDINGIKKDNTMRIVHMGDIGTELTHSQYEKIIHKPVDLLLMPVGGYYTVEPELAAKIVCKIQPKVIIPMHYKKVNPLNGEKVFGFDEISEAKAFVDAYRDLVQVTNYINFSNSEVDLDRVYQMDRDTILEMVPQNMIS